MTTLARPEDSREDRLRRVVADCPPVPDPDPGGTAGRRPEPSPNPLSQDTLSWYYTKSRSPSGDLGKQDTAGRRAWRQARRRFLWRCSKSVRVLKCGRCRISGQPVVRLRDGVAHYA